MIHHRLRRSGFSLTELLAAIVILTVVSAATVATVAPMRASADRNASEQKRLELNQRAMKAPAD